MIESSDQPCSLFHSPVALVKVLEGHCLPLGVMQTILEPGETSSRQFVMGYAVWWGVDGQ